MDKKLIQRALDIITKNGNTWFEYSLAEGGTERDAGRAEGFFVSALALKNAMEGDAKNLDWMENIF